MQEKFDVKDYLSNFYKGTKNPSLKTMRYLMEVFGNPEKKINVIHIAGTNGKGSCTEIITNILIKAGYKVGKFIGPHLQRYNERISIQNKDILDSEMIELILKIKPKIEEYEKINNIKVTLFELLTTMAILYFYDKKCDFVILETGLGGLYDCTNVVNPLVSIITSIGYDHMHILGNTLEDIARQKAGIIKENSETIFAFDKHIGVNNLIKQTCISKRNQLHIVDTNNIKNYSYNNEFQKFDYKEYKDVLINLKGEKQVLNSCLSIECIEVLRKMLYVISEEAMRDGLKNVIHKGRFEIINKYPLMVFDGAHNKPAIENFINSVKMYYENEKKIFVISILKTKDYEMILKELLKIENSIFIFTSGNDVNKFVSKEELYELAKVIKESKEFYKKELEEAIRFVNKECKSYVVFFVGSFYVYGDVERTLYIK